MSRMLEEKVKNNIDKDMQIDTKGEIAFKLRIKVKEYSHEKAIKSFQSKDSELKSNKEVRNFNKDIPDSIVRTMIDKFLNETFLTSETDLNRARRSEEEEDGDLEWNVTNLVRHKLTKEYDKMPYDRYGNIYDENSKDDFVPVAFYFDIGFMSFEKRIDDKLERYIELIAIEFAKRGISIMIGNDLSVSYQIDKLPEKFTVEDLKEFLNILSGCYVTKRRNNAVSDLQNRGVSIRRIGQDPKKYWKEKKVKKMVVFTNLHPMMYDAFDALLEVYEKGEANAKFTNSVKEFSKECEIWWFEMWNGKDIDEYFENTENLHHYKITQISDLKRHLDNINSRVYEKEHREEVRRIVGGLEH